MARAVGIDLGTTNSVVAVLERGEPVVIASAEGTRTTPSVVAFGNAGEVMVGEVAKRQAVTNLERTFRSVKRSMGTNWSAQVGEETFTAPQISATILRKLKRDAEDYLGEPVVDAVITVPAYFNDAQRQATTDAGQIAGLNVTRIVNEPTAAALAYGLQAGTEEELVMVFDLGGGTFDISLLEVVTSEDGHATVQVRATSGDNELGGDDWDAALAAWIRGRFEETSGVDLSGDAAAAARLLEAAEAAKMSLSSAYETKVTLPYIAMGADGAPSHLDVSVTRSDFQVATSDLLERCKVPFAQVVTDADITIDEIDHVVLVGGSTRMPAVVNLVAELTGGKSPHRGVNPDEVVAMGAALQAGVLGGEVKDVLLIDVTPLSLGIETRGGTMSALIERNTAVPVRRTEVFTTGADNQASVKIGVFQGERPIAADNKLLGNFKLTGVPPAERGVPRIEVTFDIDANGIVHVSAKDLGTGQEHSMTVTGSSGLSATDIERMVADAERYAVKDESRRALAQARVEAEMTVHTVLSFVEDHLDLVPAGLVEDLRMLAVKVKDVIADPSSTGAAVRVVAHSFSVAARRLGAQIYDDAALVQADLDDLSSGAEEEPAPGVDFAELSVEVTLADLGIGAAEDDTSQDGSAEATGSEADETRQTAPDLAGPQI